ncbi:MAG: hypothetical protein ACD_10C00627G0001 [uncultured bacterium]|nr:MAG: hypothetical protein ACD_10C00627G0001 [uncultured bacterium]
MLAGILLDIGGRFLDLGENGIGLIETVLRPCDGLVYVGLERHGAFPFNGRGVDGIKRGLFFGQRHHQATERQESRFGRDRGPCP